MSELRSDRLHTSILLWNCWLTSVDRRPDAQGAHCDRAGVLLRRRRREGLRCVAGYRSRGGGSLGLADVERPAGNTTHGPSLGCRAAKERDGVVDLENVIERVAIVVEHLVPLSCFPGAERDEGLLANHEILGRLRN